MEKKMQQGFNQSQLEVKDEFSSLNEQQKKIVENTPFVSHDLPRSFWWRNNIIKKDFEDCRLLWIFVIK